jgi:8-oxo-dGTP diphosphatase
MSNRPHLDSLRDTPSPSTLKRVLVAAGLIRAPKEHPYAGKILMSRRLADAHLPNSWEFPGGKVEPGEDPKDALSRELMEELNIEVSDLRIYAVGHHTYPQKEIILLVYECWHSGGTPQALHVSSFEWLSIEEVCALELPPADEEVIDRLRAERPTIWPHPSPQGPPRSIIFETRGAEALQTLGVALGQSLLSGVSSTHNGPLLLPQLIAARGELGAGKTTLAQGIARGLGVPPSHYVNSPTFSLLQTHPAPRPFHHIDLYRLENEEELDFLGFDELIEDGVAYVEWPERGPQLFTGPHLEVRLTYPSEGTETRLIELSLLGLSIDESRQLIFGLNSSLLIKFR